MTDPLLRLLHDLPPATLDPSRADRIRRRCHATLGTPNRNRWSGTAPLWTSVAAGVGSIYLVAVLRQALTAYGL